MPGIPEGISTALVHLDAPVSFIGHDGRIHATITPSIPLVWAATGTPIGNFIDNISLDPGVPLELDLPHVDQPGFLDGSGNTVMFWSYRIDITYEKDGQNIAFPSRDFQILVGQLEVDLALIPSGEAYVPVVAPILPVTSLDGLTGEVTAAELAALPVIAGKLDDTQLGAASGVAPLDSGSRVPQANLPAHLTGTALDTRSRIFTATADLFPGLDDTGATDAAAALLAIATAAPAGSTIKLPGTYRVETQLPLPADRIYDNTGGSFILAGAGTAIICQGTFDAQQTVTTLSTAAITMDNNVATTVAKLTMSAAPGWVRGDVIKVISDDVIPAAHVTSSTNKPRVGEFAVVYDVVGNDVFLHGLLREAAFMTTAIRAARLPKSTVTIINPTGRVLDATVTARGTVNFIRCQNLINPTITGVRVDQLTGMGLSFKSCLGYRVEAGASFYNTDDTATGVVGYSVHDSSCNFGYIAGGLFMGGRHAYTDGAADIVAGSTDTSSYGATIGTKLVDCKALFMKHAGFDTHHQSLNIEFINCTVYGTAGAPAFLLRGRRHRIVNPTVFGGREVLYVGTQVTGAYSEGESFGHELINPYFEGVERLVTDARRTAVAHPSYNVRDDRATRVVGGYGTGLKRVFVLVNSTIRQSGTLDVEMGPVIDGGNIINLTNSTLVGSGTIRVDGSAIATLGANNWVINCDDSASAHSIVRLARLSLLMSAAYAAGMAAGPITINSQTAEFTIEDLYFENYPWATSTPIDATDTNLGVQNIKYRVNSDSSSGSQPATRSSAWLGKSNSSLTTTMRNLFRSTDPSLTLALTINDSTSRQLIVLPPGKFTGQRLTIFVAAINGGAGITVKTGATGNIDLIGGVDKVLTVAGQSITAIYGSSRWIQVGPESTVLVAPNNTRWALTVGDDGALTTTAL